MNGSVHIQTNGENGLFQVDIANESVLPLLPGERLADYLYEWSKVLKKESDNVDRHYRLLFKRQFVINPKDDLQANERQTLLLYNQAVSDIKTGMIPTDKDSALAFIAMQLQVLFDDDKFESDPSHFDKNSLLQYVPKHLQATLSKDKHFVSEFNKAYSTVRTKTSEECRSLYIAKAITNPLYGATVFHVSVKTPSKKQEKNLIFALTAKQATLYPAYSTDPFAEFNYLDIFQFGLIPNHHQFVIEIGSLLTPEKWILSGTETEFIHGTLQYYKNLAEKH